MITGWNTTYFPGPVKLDLIIIFCPFVFLAADDDEIPQELLLGKHQVNELGSESAKIKAMGITGRVCSAFMPKCCFS